MTAYAVRAIVTKPWFLSPRIRYQIIKHYQEWSYDGLFGCELCDRTAVLVTVDDKNDAELMCRELNTFKGEKP